MRKKLFALLVMFSIAIGSTSSFADSWNGVGPITAMYIYPNYAVIIQGPVSAGPAGCPSNDGTWSFNWSDLPDQATQGRVMSMLLSAYLSGKPIQVAISSSGCGPEGKKKFNGQFYLG